MIPSNLSSQTIQELPVEHSNNSTLKIPKKFFLIPLYFAAIPLVLITLVLSSLFIHQQNSDSKGKTSISLSTSTPKYQAVPEESTKSKVTVDADDARVKSLEEFFKRYNSPLFGHAQTIVAEADKHHLDYRFIPAIAMQESTLCKKIIKNSFNCWGFGIYGKKVTKFTSYDEAIKTVTATLAKKYIAQGLNSPEEIMSKYTPSSNGSWADAVSLVMNNLHESL